MPENTPPFPPLPPLMILLDRDGTIIVDKHYLSDPDGVELLPRAADGLALLQAHGCVLVVCSNQSGVERGYFDEGAVTAVNTRMEALLAAQGVRLHALRHCPHSPHTACTCRKPAPGMVHDVAAALDLQASVAAGRCVAVGDKLSDVALGQRLKGKGVLLLTGKGPQETQKIPLPTPYPPDVEMPYTSTGHVFPDHIAQDMLDAARWIVQECIHEH